MRWLLLAQASNQQKVNELMQSARQHEMLGYILGGVGIALIIAQIPIWIYMDRKKKRKRAAPQEPYE